MDASDKPTMALPSRRKFLRSLTIGAGSALLAACGGAATTPSASSGGTTTADGVPAPTTAASGGDKKSIRFSSYSWSGYEDAMKQVQAMWKQENPNVDIITEFAGDGYWTKLQTQVAAGTPPDVGIGSFDLTVSYAKSGVLMPLDEQIAADGFKLDRFIPAGVAQYRWADGEFNSGGEGGKMYGLPSDGQGHIFAYNKNMFDAAGVKYPDDNWTWNDLVTAAKQITKADDNKWGVAAPGLGIVGRGNFLFSAGADFTTPDFKKSALNSPAAREVFKWIWDLIYTHKVAPQPVPSEKVEPFSSGRVAMAFAGVWQIADWKLIKDFNWDIAMFPKHPTTGKRTTSLESDGWWAFKGSKEPQLAWSLLKYMADSKAQQKFSDLEFVVPSSIPEIARTWYAKTPPTSRAKAFENIEKDSHKLIPTFFDSSRINAAFYPVFDKAFFDGQDIDAVLKEASGIIDDELTKSWQKFNEG